MWQKPQQTPWLEVQIWGSVKAQEWMRKPRKQWSMRQITTWKQNSRKFHISGETSGDLKWYKRKSESFKKTGYMNNVKNNSNTWQLLELQHWEEEASRERQIKDQVERRIRGLGKDYIGHIYWAEDNLVLYKK